MQKRLIFVGCLLLALYFIARWLHFALLLLLVVSKYSRYYKEGVWSGYFAKLSVICGLGPPSILLKRRWELVYAKHDKSKCKSLVVSWSGGAIVMGGIPRAEFRKTLVDDVGKQCDMLFLVDPTGMSFYQNASVRLLLNKKLSSTCAEYERVIFVGNCMGGTGALLYAQEATHVLAFKPVINASWQNAHGGAGLSYWFGATLECDGAENFQKLIVNNCERAACKTVISMFAGTSEDEKHFAVLPNMQIAPWTADRKPGIYGTVVEILNPDQHGGKGRSLVGSMRSDGSLASMIRSLIL